jgi:hypothetical protein
VREADELRRQGRFRNAGLKCNQAVQLVPDFGRAYLRRTQVYLYYCGIHWNKLTPHQRAWYAAWAFEDSTKCIELDPTEHLAYRLKAQAAVYWLYADPDHGWYEWSLTEVNLHLVNEFLDDRERAWFTNCRAQIHLLLQHFEDAEDDYNESILLNPSQPRWYLNRAQYWDSRGRSDRAADDRHSAAVLEPLPLPGSR